MNILALVFILIFSALLILYNEEEKLKKYPILDNAFKFLHQYLSKSIFKSASANINKNVESFRASLVLIIFGLVVLTFFIGRFSEVHNFGIIPFLLVGICLFLYQSLSCNWEQIFKVALRCCYVFIVVSIGLIMMLMGMENSGNVQVTSFLLDTISEYSPSWATPTSDELPNYIVIVLLSITLLIFISVVLIMSWGKIAVRIPLLLGKYSSKVALKIGLERWKFFCFFSFTLTAIFGVFSLISHSVL